MKKVYRDKGLGYSEATTFDVPGDFDPCQGSGEIMPDDGEESIEEVFE